MNRAGVGGGILLAGGFKLRFGGHCSSIDIIPYRLFGHNW